MNNNVFSFRKVTYEEILNEINSLDTSKSTQSEDIPFKIIKDNADIFANFILQNFNKCIIDGKFPDQWKKQTLVLSLKRETIMTKPIIDRWVSYPRYERLIYNQINHITENVLSIFQCGFRKKYSTQHALVAMTEKAI